MKKNKKVMIIAISIFVLVVIISLIVIAFVSKSSVETEVEIGGQVVDIVDSGDGLYIDEYITGRYIYRGVDPDNYITFNGEIWRIVSVDSDGNIQIMRDELLEEIAFDSKGVRGRTDEDESDVSSCGDTTDEDESSGDYCEYSNDGCNAWAAISEFTNGNFSGAVSENSEMLTYLNEDYYNSLSSEAQSLIISHNWSIGGTNGEEDLSSQVDIETASEWNGKVGLITASDYIKASIGDSCDSLYTMNINYVSCAENNWMVKYGIAWWTITPTEDSLVRVWYVGEYGFINNEAASQLYSVRPVVYLSSDIELSGDGSEDNPFTII